MKKLTPIKAIRANCLDCMCGSSNEVKLCPSDDCPLYPYRFGKRPVKENGLKRKINPKAIKALKDWREKNLTPKK